MSNINQSSVPARHLLPTIRAGLIGLFPGVVARWRHRQTMATLSRLDARQLEDIGMSRNDILRRSAVRITSKEFLRPLSGATGE